MYIPANGRLTTGIAKTKSLPYCYPRQPNDQFSTPHLRLGPPKMRWWKMNRLHRPTRNRHLYQREVQDRQQECRNNCWCCFLSNACYAHEWRNQNFDTQRLPCQENGQPVHGKWYSKWCTKSILKQATNNTSYPNINPLKASIKQVWLIIVQLFEVVLTTWLNQLI